MFKYASRRYVWNYGRIVCQGGIPGSKGIFLEIDIGIVFFITFICHSNECNVT